MIINHNMNAMNAHRNMGMNNTAAGKSMEKLSSGLRINRAGDDAAGLAISEKMRGQIRGLDQASRNAQDGISLIQTAEGALNETQNILQRMRELSVQSANDTNNGDDRGEIQKEMNQLIDEIDRIANNTQFNEQNLLNGSYAGKEVHVGANSDQTITVNIGAMGTGNIGTGSKAAVTRVLSVASTTSTNAASAVIIKTSAVAGVESAAAVAKFDVTDLKVSALGTNAGVKTQAGANAAITVINDAIKQVSGERSKLGAVQNRLEYTTKNLDNTSENLTAAESRIRDVDMAKEMLNFSKNNILNQAAQSMLAQAKSQPEGVLQLLR